MTTQPPVMLLPMQSSADAIVGMRDLVVAFDGIREEATLGARTTLDVLDAEQDLLDARAAPQQEAR